MADRPRLAFFEMSEWERASLDLTRLDGSEVLVFAEDLSPRTAALARDCDVVSCFIYSRVDAAVLDAIPRLRLVTTRSTGYDHIDMDACAGRSVTVCNVPSYGENTVAEHTFGLILSLSRNIHKAYVRTVRGDFSLEGLRGFDLKGKALGVIGAGHIGLHVIRMARAFGMEVLAYDVQRNPFLEEVLGFRYVPLDELLARSDIVSLHCPYIPATHHLLNRANIRKIKRGAILINTARGPLVETEALISALDEGILSGAGLDVLEGEEMIKEERQILAKQYPADKLRTLVQNHILMQRENVVITPHLGFYSVEALQRILDTTVQNILGFIGGAPPNRVERKSAGLRAAAS